MRRGLWPALFAFPLVLCACDRSSPGDTAPVGGMGAAGGMMHGTLARADTTGLRALPVPEQHREGAALFSASCAVCHGEAALGSDTGPPLVHVFYEPNHHADIAFFLAAERGVRAHHWGFGDMPPQPGVSRAELTQIIGYVRWLQREAGID